MRRLALVAVAATLPMLALAGGPASIEPRDLGTRIAWADPSLAVLDVRTPAEFAEGHIPGAINIPHTELAARMADLEDLRERDIVVYCGSGRRAELALGVLQESGFKRLFHLKGDYTRWSEEQRPIVRPQ